MYYVNGYPRFCIEKPLRSAWLKDKLKVKESTGQYFAELKLNEHRGFLCIDDNGKAVFYTYRHRNPVKIRGEALARIEAMGLPRSSIFDGGHLFRKEFGPTRIYIFDALVISGEKCKLSCEMRRGLLDKLIKTDDLIWRPLWTEKWVDEFEAMIYGESQLIKEAALAYGFPYEKLLPLIEGFVLKRKDSLLKFPYRQIESASFLKLRLADLPRSFKNKR